MPFAALSLLYLSGWWVDLFGWWVDLIWLVGSRPLGLHALLAAGLAAGGGLVLFGFVGWFFLPVGAALPFPPFPSLPIPFP